MKFYLILLSLVLGASSKLHGSSSFETISDNCEANCPACPDKDTSLFDSSTGELLSMEEPSFIGLQNMLLQNADSYGEWVVSTSCDDKLYLFSDCGLDWFDARDKCCKLGMNLISLPTQDEYDCFAEANTATSGQWWTSATDEGCTYKSKLVFSWCSEPQQLMDDVYSSSDEKLHRWHKKEPNNAKDDEKCVRLETDGGDTYLTDKSCNNMYKYVCEGPTTPAPGPTCTSQDVTCPPYPDYDLSYFPGQYGTLFTSSTSTDFIVSNVKKTWAEASDICCKLAMVLVAFEDSTKVNNYVSRGASAFLTGATDYYWTSGTDAGCPAASAANFIWCSFLVIEDSVDGSLFATGEPNFSSANEKCVGLLAGPQKLYDLDCTATHYFVCETA